MVYDLKRRVLVIGDSFMNLQMSVPGAVKTLGTVYGDSYSFHPCGESAVSAITAAKSGADCTLCTRLGDDFNGEKLFDYYKACGIDPTFIRKIPSSQTGVVFTAYDNVSNVSYVTKGANALLSKSDIDDAFSCFPDVMLIPHDYIAVRDSQQLMTRADSATTEIDRQIGDVRDFQAVTQPQSSRPENLALYAINKAIERGVEMVVEYTDTTSLLPLDKVSGIKIIVISEEMLKKVTGTAPISIEKTLSALLSFSSKIHSKYYVVQKGNDRTFVYDGIHFEIPQAPAVVAALAHQEYQYMHKTYTGALIGEYLNSRDILKACKYAQIVSLMTRAPMGIFQHVPSRAQVEESLAKHGLSIDTI